MVNKTVNMKMCVLMMLLLGASTLVMAQAKKPSAPSSKASGGMQAAITRGKTVYASFCLACHQADGSGVPNLNPPLIQTEWVTGSKTTLIDMVLKGSRGQVEIDGETFHNTMPAQAHLTDLQIADVLTYIRNNFGNKASDVSATEVKTARAKIKS
jgi:mono/diheme cytochrome c family protein